VGAEENEWLWNGWRRSLFGVIELSEKHQNASQRRHAEKHAQKSWQRRGQAEGGTAIFSLSGAENGGNDRTGDVLAAAASPRRRVNGRQRALARATLSVACYHRNSEEKYGNVKAVEGGGGRGVLSVDKIFYRCRETLLAKSGRTRNFFFFFFFFRAVSRAVPPGLPGLEKISSTTKADSLKEASCVVLSPLRKLAVPQILPLAQLHLPSTGLCRRNIQMYLSFSASGRRKRQARWGAEICRRKESGAKWWRRIKT